MSLIRGSAYHPPIKPGSIDLIIKSPPYYGQRDYEGDDPDQIGEEQHPQQYLEHLWAVGEACWDLLTPEGSMFVNLGDKRAGSGAPGTTIGSTLQGTQQNDRGKSGVNRAESGALKTGTERSGGMSTYTKEWFGRKKGRQMLPERYAIGMADGMGDPDGIGWIVRQDLTWLKPNGMPESVTDRCRDNTETFWHLTKSGDYYAAIDDLRVPYSTADRDPSKRRSYPAGSASSINADGEHVVMDEGFVGLPLNERGRLPGSVWEIPSSVLRIPPELEVEHYAPFPAEWPRRLILGWCPKTVCLECGRGRFPVNKKSAIADRLGRVQGREGEVGRFDGQDGRLGDRRKTIVTVTGLYACGCTPVVSNPLYDPDSESDEPKKLYDFDSWTPTPTRKARVLDPFGGTGTTAMVANAMGRVGISLDLSEAYQVIADWRLHASDHASKVRERTNREAQTALW